MDTNLNNSRGYEAMDITVGGNHTSQEASNGRVMEFDKKKASVHAEMDRVNKLPTNSTYAVHRLRVLNKLLHLLSIQPPYGHVKGEAGGDTFIECASTYPEGASSWDQGAVQRRSTAQDEELELLFAGLSL